MLLVSRRLLRATSVPQVRHGSTQSSPQLLAKLLCNPELDAAEAKSELRWMKQSLQPGHHPDELAALVERRAQGEPLQYILGSTDFGPLTLKCRAPTLIPRPETAEIFSRLAHLVSSCRSPRMARPLSIVDLCTGSAPIPLLLRHQLGEDAQITGYDLRPSAIELARDNAQQTGLDVKLLVGDVMSPDFSSMLLADTGGHIDMLSSNPPYITDEEYRSLPASVKNYEDPAALLGDIGSGVRGLDFYERIAKLLPSLLAEEKELVTGGWKDLPRVALEIGLKQGRDVREIVNSAGMSKVDIWQDQYGRDRMVIGWT